MRLYKIILILCVLNMFAIPEHVLAEIPQLDNSQVGRNQKNEIKVPSSEPASQIELKDIETSINLQAEVQRIKSLLKNFNQNDAEARRRIIDELNTEPAVFAVILKDECSRFALSGFGLSVIPLLSNALDNESSVVRKHTIKLLGDMRQKARDAVPKLIQKLNDNDKHVRVSTVEALRIIDVPRDQIIPAVIKMLDDKEPEVRQSSVRAMIHYGKDARQAVPALKKIAANDESEFTRGLAKEALKNIGPTTTIDYIIKYGKSCISLLFILIFIFLFILFLKRNYDVTNKAVIYSIFSCFGHPVYLVLAAYITGGLGLINDVSTNVVQLDFFGYIAVLIILFLLRFYSFLYISVMSSRISLQTILVPAFNKFVTIHKYCAWGLPLFIAFVIPLEGNIVGFIYAPIFFILLIPSLFQTGASFKAAFSSKQWALINKESEKSIVNSKTALTPEEKKKIIFTTLLIAVFIALIILAVFIGKKISFKESKQALEFIGVKKDSAEYHIESGFIYTYKLPISSDNIMKAIDEYNNAIEIDHKLSLAYMRRGEAYLQLKQYEKAILDFNKVEEIGDDLMCDMYKNRGTSYKALGQYDKMCEDYKKSCCVEICSFYEQAKKEGFCKD
jgi:tetratricopeptide (TPR) repeat protein